jgi:hypothetical protein
MWYMFVRNYMNNNKSKNNAVAQMAFAQQRCFGSGSASRSRGKAKSTLQR